MSACRADEVLGHTIAEFDVWESPTDRQQVIQRLHEQGSVHNVETRFRRRSSDLYSVLLSMTRVDVGGEPCLISMLTDITERKQAEAALRESEEMLRSIFASTPDSITVTDVNGRIVLCNQTTAHIHGFSSVEQLMYGESNGITAIPKLLKMLLLEICSALGDRALSGTTRI